VERVAEWYALVTCLVVGLSHLLHPRAWAAVFAALHGSASRGRSPMRPQSGARGGVRRGPPRLVRAGRGADAPRLDAGAQGAICFLAPSLALRAWARPGRATAESSRRGACYYWPSPASWVTYCGPVEVTGQGTAEPSGSLFPPSLLNSLTTPATVTAGTRRPSARRSRRRPGFPSDRGGKRGYAEGSDLSRETPSP